MNQINMTQMLAQMKVMASQAGGADSQSGNVDGNVDFASLLKGSIDSVNDTKKQAGKLAEAFEKGDPQVDLAQVMVALQKASISFQTMTTVRNKLVEAYKDIKNMPI